jgi:hypothetical protein
MWSDGPEEPPTRVPYSQEQRFSHMSYVRIVSHSEAPKRVVGLCRPPQKMGVSSGIR